MNKIGGRVVLRESNIGIPDLLVVIYDLDPGTQPEEAIPVAGRIAAAAAQQIDGDRLGSVLTGQDGSFELTYENSEFQVRNAKEMRPDLLLSVLAPEEPGQDPQARILYVSNGIRQNAGLTEHYLIRLGADQLLKAGITPPSAESQDTEPATSVLGRLTENETRESTITDGTIGVARQRVDSHRARFAGFPQKLKPALVATLSRLPSVVQDRDRLVGDGESVFQKSKAAMQEGIKETFNSNDPRKRAPARGFMSLTQAEVEELRSYAGPDGTIPGAAVMAVAAQNGQGATSTFLQASDRLPLCQPNTAGTDCAASLLDPPAVPPAPGELPPAISGSGVATITGDDIPRYLARLMETLTAPEEQLLTGLMPVATRDSVQSSIQNLLFPPSPADVPAFHDFSGLQIAFDYVWQEAIDEGVLDLAQDAYETIVELGGDPNRDEYKSTHPVKALLSEGRSILNAIRGILGLSGGHVSVSSTSRPDTNGTHADDCTGSDEMTVRDHRTGSAGTIVRDHRTGSADPVERLPALLQALEAKLLENYSFTIYAANAKERSVNFGILYTYRQIWTPLSYQAGPLVKSIPLAPKQTQKVVITRKTTKKRSRKELENNLRVLKDESSTTNRAEQEIARRASSKNDFSIENTSSANLELESSTTTTKFGREAAKSSDDIKKSFHEAVFKSAQEFKQERTTEINTEETEDFETTETTEISNPNDEIAVTFLFYELQRRYRIYERLYRVQPVVLVAQEFPQPHEINQAWLIAHDWILKRVILDDSFLPTLNSLCQSAGAESALAELRINVKQQRCIVAQVREQLASATQRATLQRALLERHWWDFVIGADAQSDRQAVQDRAQEAADHARDLMFRLEREVTALNALTEVYTKALREHHTHLTEIARLENHVKGSIVDYMHAIWSHEPRDQRFFRLHNVPVPVFNSTSRGFRVDFDHPISPTMTEAHKTLARFGGRDVQVFPTEATAQFGDELQFAPLSQVADLDNLLGYKGNYMIFPLHESNPLTDFMMDPFVDRATGQLVDPSDLINWSIDEFSQYVCCLKEELSEDEFAQLLSQLREQYQAILSAPRRNNDVLVVPTNSLFIEALPAEHSLIEKFKRDHRMVDVKKVQSEVREKELENIRRAARILAGEREDPEIDKKVVIEGGIAGPGVLVDDPV